MTRVDTHHHMIPPDYRKMLRAASIDEAGGRVLPDWSPEASLHTMAELDIATAILSVSTPGTTFRSNVADAAALARDLNDYSAQLVADQPDRFGFFATVPMPHIGESVTESVRALDELKADGVVLLANNAGTYLGQEGQDDLWAALNGRSAVVFIHPADLPGPTVPGVAPFVADFPAPHTFWYATAFVASIRTSASSSVTPVGSFRTPVTAWQWRSRPTPVAAQQTASTTSPASTSTPHYPPAPPRCPPCLRSPSPATSRSAPTGPSRQWLLRSCLPPDWRPSPSWTTPPGRPSTAATRWPCSRASPRHPHLRQDHAPAKSVAPPAELPCAASPDSSALSRAPEPGRGETPGALLVCHLVDDGTLLNGRRHSREDPGGTPDPDTRCPDVFFSHPCHK